MPDGNLITTPRRVEKQVFRCRLHDKQGKYELSFYPHDNTLYYRCLLCPRDEHLVQVQLPKQGVAHA